MNNDNKNFYDDPHSNMAISSKNSKKIVGKIRGGNYQHPGEEHAIDMLFNLSMNKKSSAHILDIGCGLGATAAYVNKNKWGSVVAIDLNKDLIDEANRHYPNERGLVFIHSPVELLNQYIKNTQPFDIMYAFNSFFLFDSHKAALNQLLYFSCQKTELLIFDYINYGDYHNYYFFENNKKLLPNCININGYLNIFEECSWKINKTIDISNEYIFWYEELLKKLRKEDCNLQHKDPSVGKLLLRYEHIYEMLTKKILGGIIVHANPIG
jgi:SAM-dependent methyltransferase